MNKEQKIKIVTDLTAHLTQSKNIYFTEIFGLDAQQTSMLRRMCFDKGVTLSVVKNTLLQKAMDACDKDLSDFNTLLKGNTALMISDIANAPAKVIKNFLDKEKLEKTSKKLNLKGGHVEESTYLGHEQLDVLASLKSKEELIGDVIMLLQSPIKNVLSSLGSAQQNIASVLVALESNSGTKKEINSSEGTSSEDTSSEDISSEDTSSEDKSSEEMQDNNEVKEN